MRRDNLILINMICSLAMVMIDQTVVGVVLPPLQRTFDFTPSELQWVVNAYTLALASMLICGGWLGDRFGRFNSFAAGATIFALASLTCAIAPNGELFIAGRAAQGVGAALMQPAASALVFSAFDQDRRARAMSIYVSSGLLFMAVGPLIGGILTGFSSWHAVFLINVPIGIAAAAGAMYLRQPQDSGQVRPFDRLGALLLLTGTVCLTFAIQGSGTGWLTCAAFVAAGVVSFGWLYDRRNRPGGSIVNFEMLANREFFGCCVLLFCIQFAMLGQVVYGAIFIQNVLEFSPIQAGFAMLPVVLTIAVTAQVAGLLYIRVPYRWLAVGGTAAIAIGFVAQAFALVEGSLIGMIPGMFLGGVGVGLLASTVMVHALGLVSPHERSSASGMVQTIRQIGGVFGVACIGAIVNLSEASGIARVVPTLSSDPEMQHRLQTLLYKAEAQSAEAISELQKLAPVAITDLKEITSTAISEAYVFGAVVVLFACLWSAWAFYKPTEATVTQATPAAAR
ncbi:MAG: MFS transporter [Alphaproteobacteria bacterium]|nr:MFS transporter [Alphaproteobacteria bacterium]